MQGTIGLCSRTCEHGLPARGECIGQRKSIRLLLRFRGG
jgi:hypothetical protein